MAKNHGGVADNIADDAVGRKETGKEAKARVEAQYVKFIKSHPKCRVSDVAEFVGTGNATVRRRMQRMTAEGTLTVETAHNISFYSLA